MRRRLTVNIHTGLGNPSPEVFNNEWTNNEDFNNDAKAFFDDILKSVKDFEEIGGFDFSMNLREDGFRIMFGIEPTYKDDPYICYCIDSNKDEIYIQKGKANGYYGSDIVINEELNYNEGMCTKEFKSCIDAHYDKLMEYVSS